MLNKKSAILAISSIVFLTAVSAGTVSAKEMGNRQFRGEGAAIGGRGMMGGGNRLGQGVYGSVVSVSGTTITINSGMGAMAKTYTVDASKATFAKISAPTTLTPGTTPTKPTPTTITITDIAVGDMVSVAGTVSGTNVTATTVTVTSAWKGESPVGGKMVFGTVQAVSGSTLTIVAKQGMVGRFKKDEVDEQKNANANTPTATTVTYTVDASAGIIKKVAAASTGATVPTAPTTIAVSDIVVGDTVSVSGLIDGTNIKATTIVDGVVMPGKGGSLVQQINNHPQTAALKAEVEALKPGLWNKIMDFFTGFFKKHNK